MNTNQIELNEKGIPLEIYTEYYPDKPQGNRFNQNWFIQAKREWVAQTEYKTLSDFLFYAKKIPKEFTKQKNFAKMISGWVALKNEKLDNQRKKVFKELAEATNEIEQLNKNEMTVVATNHLLNRQILSQTSSRIVKQLHDAVESGEVDYQWFMRNMDSVSKLYQMQLVGEKSEQSDEFSFNANSSGSKPKTIVLNAFIPDEEDEDEE